MIKIESISKSYTNGLGREVILFKDLSFEIQQSKITTILSKSGTGKTALLQKISMLDETNLTNAKRIYIPSEPSSFPWLNVRENIIFNLKVFDENYLNSVIKMVGLSGYEDHYPNNESIGFRFRISLARAIIRNPELIIIDDSITKLSQNRRSDLFTLLRNITLKMKTSVLYATSSVSDAVRISDKIILMHGAPLKVQSVKTILIDEEVRSDSSSIISYIDYFDENELSFF